jgi:endothelin-converting enzyme/putative endopeptidase
MRLPLLFLVLSTVAAAQTGFSISSIDTSADPCTDFYQYACGNWMKSNPIPPDQSRWSRFNDLQERNFATLRDILETSTAKAQRSPVEQKIGDYYTSCMDEKAIEAKGVAALKPVLDRISSINTKEELPAEIARLHKIGVNVLFGVYAAPDYKNSSINIAQADQGGLSLPDRDYYLKSDDKSVETRQKYEAHVKRMFELLGDSPEKASARANAVLKVETALAKISMDRVARRNPANRYHPMPLDEFAALTESFDFEQYLATLDGPAFERLNAVNPDFFKGLEQILNEKTLADLKTYLTWMYLNASAPMLPAKFVEENFAFYGRTLGGAKELKPRWKRCVDAVDSDLGEALGQKYVELTFGANAKQRMAELIKNLEVAMAKDIESLDWMTEATKKRALEKLKAIQNKVGHPEKWRDYSPLEIRRDDALGNSQRSNTFAFMRTVNKIGQPPDPKEWVMSPPTVNAYYSPLQNNINFPAGILQPPFFDAKLDDAVNYGGIGAVIGHEITHGFDDSGRRFDAKGNMTDWWTAEDAKLFEERAGCVEKQYSNYVAVADVKLNGKLTLGENVADNGGLRIAFMALQAANQGKDVGKIDGYNPEQRFFLGWGQVWCQNITDEQSRLRAVTDPHSPGKYRVNGTLSNMPEFHKAFGCKAGQPMVSASACRVW